MSLPIETERLLLREYDDGDAADILEYSSDEDFWTARIWDWQPTARGVRSYWGSRRKMDPDAESGSVELVVELKSEGKVIGNTGIWIQKSCEHRQGSIGWMLGAGYRGRGFATEAGKAFIAFAFDRMGLHRIFARTGADNTRSWLLMEHLGMRREAHFRQSHRFRGEWRDEYVYAILAHEWSAKHDQ